MSWKDRIRKIEQSFHDLMVQEITKLGSDMLKEIQTHLTPNELRLFAEGNRALLSAEVKPNPESLEIAKSIWEIQTPPVQKRLLILRDFSIQYEGGHTGLVDFLGGPEFENPD